MLAITRAEASVRRIPLARPELVSRVAALRRGLALLAPVEAELEWLAHALFDAALAEKLATAKQLVVVPHGALYHACVTHPEQAEAVATAAHEYDPSMAVLGAPGSPLLAVADALGMEAVAEGFADRAYRPDGTLVPRSAPGATPCFSATAT